MGRRGVLATMRDKAGHVIDPESLGTTKQEAEGRDVLVICRKPSVLDLDGGALPAPLLVHDEAIDVESVRQAADHGDPIAQLSLARVYQNGEGLPMDNNKGGRVVSESGGTGESDGSVRTGTHVPGRAWSSSRSYTVARLAA